MAIRKIDRKEHKYYLDGGDGYVEKYVEYGGLTMGMSLPSGAVILDIFEHPESSCAFVVTESKEQLYCVEIDYLPHREGERRRY